MTTNNAINVGTGTAGAILTATSGGTPVWTTATYPATSGTANNIISSNGTNFVSSTLTSIIDAAIGNVQGDILYRNNSAWVVLAPGTAGQVLTTGGASANPSWTTGTSKILQTVFSEVSSVSTGTTVIPLDDTIPQNTEGDQYLSVTITPTSSTSRLRIEVLANFGIDVSRSITTALFQDSTANALAACVSNAVGSNTNQSTLIHNMVSGTTSATTFKVRIGVNVTSATITFNGLSGGRLMGGVMASSITVTEYNP